MLKSRITEKTTTLAARASGGFVYTFRVPATANKHQVAEEFKKTYKLKPLRVNMIKGKGGNFKKALVYLSKGDKIEFV